MALSERIADFVVGLDSDGIPEKTRKAAIRAFADTMGCGLAGATEESSRMVFDCIGSVSAPGRCITVGFGKRLGPVPAAFINAKTCHALDLDDTHEASVSHPAITAVVAGLAAAEEVGATGRSLLEAIVAGYDVTARLALGPDVGPKSGWVLTAVCGIFGATAAAGKIFGLDRDQMVNAFGIAHCMSSGNTQPIVDGVWTKRLQVGHAAGMGVLSAQLAWMGFTGASGAFDGTFGLFPVYFKQYDLDRVTEGLGERFEVDNSSLKPYPSCRFTHAVIDAAFALVKSDGVDTGNIGRIEVGVSEQAFKLCADPIEKKRNPETAVDAQFSIPYVVASVFARKHFFIDSLTPEAIKDEEVIRLANKVYCVVDDEMERRSSREISPARVRVKMNDGKVLEETVEAPKGSVENPLTDDDLREKFMNCAKMLIPPEKAQRVYEMLIALDRLESLSELTAMLAL